MISRCMLTVIVRTSFYAAIKMIWNISESSVRWEPEALQKSTIWPMSKRVRLPDKTCVVLLIFCWTKWWHGSLNINISMYIKEIFCFWVFFRMQTAVDRAKLPGRRGLPRQFDDPDLANPYNKESNRKCC